MLQVNTTQKLDQIEAQLRAAAHRHGGHVLAASHVGHLLRGDQGLAGADAITFTLCFSDLYAPLLKSDIRFAAFLPARVAAWEKGTGVVLEAISPKEYCRMIGRPEIEPLAGALEDILKVVMADAGLEHRATEDMINMRAAIPQRIDCVGTKVEELAGTGAPDALGG